MKRFYVITGGTMVHIAPHLALTAPAYGMAGRMIYNELELQCKTDDGANLHLIETEMARHSGQPDGHVLSLYEDAGITKLETNEDLSKLLDVLTARPDTKAIFLAAAICDYEPSQAFAYNDPNTEGDLIKMITKFGKDQPRMETKYGPLALEMRPTEKLVKKIRQKRKDIFLVAFKTTAGATADEQYAKGLHLLKSASANLVLANDIRTRLNMVITPEEARYHQTELRGQAIENLVEMALLRSHLTFTRSTVIAGEPVPWNSPEVPQALRTVVDYCIGRGAYKPFRGSTVGHFAAKIGPKLFLTSRRKTNFNDLEKLGLVKVETDGPDTVLAYGSRPSVGGQSQRILFQDHPEMDCVVHFHCPIKPGSEVPTVSQREYECGSHECGKNTSNGMKSFGTFKAVYLDQHGPNIIFNSKTIDPQVVIQFIEENFDLNSKTGGLIPEVK